MCIHLKKSSNRHGYCYLFITEFIIISSISIIIIIIVVIIII